MKYLCRNAFATVRTTKKSSKGNSAAVHNGAGGRERRKRLTGSTTFHRTVAGTGKTETPCRKHHLPQGRAGTKEKAP